MERIIIQKSSFIDAFDECIADVKGVKHAIGKRNVVIVPDKYTLFAERRLFLGGGSFDTEVVTFSRLLGKTGLRPNNALTKFGAVMLMRKLIGDGKDLKCFRRSAPFTGFAEKVYETVAQLNASLVTPDMLTAESSNAALRAKLEDIRLLQRKYLEAIEGKYTDPSGLLTLLPDALIKSGYLDGARVFIVNFDRFTAQQERIIQTIEKRAKELKVYVSREQTSLELPKNTKVETFTAPDTVTQLKAVAQRLRGALFETRFSPDALRLSDCCVVMAKPDYLTASRIFSEYGIRIALDEKYPLYLHPKSRFVFAALDAADGRLSRKKIVKLSKCALGGVTALDSFAFENYCNERRVEYKGLLKPFDDETAESVRKRIVEGIVLPLKDRLKSTMRAEEFASVVEWLTEESEKAELPSAPEHYDMRAFGAKLNEMPKQLGTVMGGGEYPLALLIATLKEGVTARSLSYLPTYADCLSIGTPDVFRGRRFKKVFVVGFDDGALPTLMKDLGMITDSEIDELSALGAVVEPKTQDVNARARSELLHLLHGCDDLFLAHTAYDNTDFASGLLTMLLKKSKCEITESSPTKESEDIEYGNEKAALIRAACSYAAAKELYVDGERREKAPSYLPTVSLALGEYNLPKFARERDFILSGSYDIFFRKRTVYISQIQTFFCCPYRHFLQYGLQLDQRPDGSVDVRDLGVILHRVAECYVGEGKFDNPVATAEELFDRLMKKEFSWFGLPPKAMARLKSESVKLCVTISKQYESSYKPFMQEEKFAPWRKLRSTQIELPGGEKADVVGVIDRVDLCGENRVRVVDYKSGYVGSGVDAVGPKKLYYGIKFQLQFYGAILKNCGYDIAGLFYFPIRDDWSDTSEYLSMVGAFDRDMDRVIEMDKELAESDASELFNAKITRTKKGDRYVNKRNSLALEKAKLSSACDYSMRVFESGVEDIVDGLIRPMPYGDSKSGACDYCPYKRVCVGIEPEYRAIDAETSDAVYGGEGDEL